MALDSSTIERPEREPAPAAAAPPPWQRLSELFEAMPAVELNNHHWLSMQALQDERGFSLAYAKAMRRRHLRRRFEGRVDLSQVLLAAPNLRHLEWPIPGTPSRHAVLREVEQQVADGTLDLAGAMVVLTNHSVQKPDDKAALQRLVQRCGETVFVGWDTDNHHGVTHSCFLAAHVDVYAPTHLDNLYPLAMMNPVLCPVPSGCVGWSRRFLRQHAGLVLRAGRHAPPQGVHAFYSCFGMRNRIVSTVGQSSPDVKLSTEPLHLGDELDYLERMSASAVHWVVPTLNDLSTRVFDALASGGLPLLPVSLRHHPALAEVRVHDIVFYDAADIIAPAAVLQAAHERFAQQGLEGVARRFDFALRHHGDFRMLACGRAAADEFGFLLTTAC